MTDAGHEVATGRADDVGVEASAPTSWLHRVAWGDAFVAVLVVAYGVYLVHGAGLIRVLPVYSRIGPRFFPYLVGCAALVCGLLLLVAAARGVRSTPDGGEDVDLTVRDNLRPVLVIAITLTIGAWLMKPAGFVIAATLIFTGVALAFGSRRLLRDVAIGFGLATVAYLAFTDLLSLTLPAGVLPF